MLTIKVWCLPPQSQKKLEGLFWDIVEAVESIKAMAQAGHTGTGNMLVLFPTDHMKLGLGAEILIEVDGLANARICNYTVRKRLAAKLGRAIEARFPKAQVDSRVYKPDPNIGRWQSHRKPMPVEHRPKH